MDLMTLIYAGGGLSGYVSVIYLLNKKFRKKVDIYASGVYRTVKHEHGRGEGLIADVELRIFNDNEDPIILTDVLATIRYNKKRYQKYEEEIAHITQNAVMAFSEHPTNFKDMVNVPPHTCSSKISLTFSFDSLIPPYLDRTGYAHFAGFIDGTPVFVCDERELRDHWECHPVEMLLTAHINGKKIVNRLVSLDKKGSGMEVEHLGSLGVVEKEKIKRNWGYNGKRVW